ncbi:ADP-ribosyltransferase [Actinoplanes sp. HUAS TT8]|uniref:ADP-ribosyltransferase n=1 Tax=Actinoplanes sp. HUAS TT8 TaxID=3447453 RepID=UPI003F52562B
MITKRLVAALLAVGAALATSASTPTTATAAAPACPLVKDKIQAAIDHDVRLARITPRPVWRAGCGTLYRSDSRAPAVVFEQGFAAKDVDHGQYDILKYVLDNQPSPYVSTTYDHDLYRSWYKSGYNYYLDAPGGVDVNRTIGSRHKYADQLEVAFPGGIRREFVIGVCPVDKTTKTEIMADCQDNPNYRPWR